MPHVTLQISPGGPIVDLLVGVSIPRAEALQRADQAVPNAVRIRGLVDTGASGTCVDPSCIRALDLSPTGQTAIHTPSTGETAHICSQYDISLVLLHPRLKFTIQALPVIEASLSLQGIQALLGRDVLARCLFVYDGAAGIFTLAF